MVLQQFAGIAQQLRRSDSINSCIHIFLHWLEQQKLSAAVVLYSQHVGWHHNGAGRALQNWIQQPEAWQYSGYPGVMDDIIPDVPVLLLPLYYGGRQQGLLAIENVSEPGMFLLPVELMMARLETLYQEEQTARSRQLMAVLSDYDQFRALLLFFMQQATSILNVDEIHIFQYEPDAPHANVWFEDDNGHLASVASGHTDYAAFSTLLADRDIYGFPGNAEVFITPEVLAIAQKREIQQLILVPVRQKNRIHGAVAFARRTSPEHHPFTGHEHDIAMMLVQALGYNWQSDAGDIQEPIVETELPSTVGINLLIQSSRDLGELSQRLYSAISQVHTPDSFVFLVTTESPDLIHIRRFEKGSHNSELRQASLLQYPLAAVMVEDSVPIFWQTETERDATFAEFEIPATTTAKSFVGLPLIARDEVLGVIYSESMPEYGFQEQELQLMLSLANSAAFAIENMQLLENSARRIYEITVINDVSQMLAQDFGSDQMWKRLAEEMMLSFPDAIPAMCLYDIKRDRLSLPDITLDDGSKLEMPPESLTRAVLQSGIALQFEDLHQEIPRLEALGIHDLEIDELRSWLGTPLRNRMHEPIGVMALQSGVPGLFRSGDTALLSTLAAQVSLALSNSRLLHSEQERHRIASTLMDMGRVVSATLNIDEVYERIIEQIMKVLSFRRAAVMIPSPVLSEDRCLLIQAVSGFDAGYIKTELRCADDSPLSKVITTQHPIVIDDWQETISSPEEHGMLAQGQPRSWMGVPMVHRKRIIRRYCPRSY